MSCVGWNDPINMPIDGAISDENKESLTGRLFKDFHQLTLSEDIYKTGGDDVLTIEQLNTLLLGFKKAGALETLTLIFNNSPRYDPLQDYEGTVVKYQGVISQVYGLVVCKLALQMMATSKRVNDTERKTKYGLLKTELEGVRNEQGIIVSRGVIGNLANAVFKAQEIIFPQPIEIIAENLW